MCVYLYWHGVEPVVPLLSQLNRDQAFKGVRTERPSQILSTGSAFISPSPSPDAQSSHPLFEADEQIQLGAYSVSVASRAAEDYKATLSPERAHTDTRAARPTCRPCAVRQVGRSARVTVCALGREGRLILWGS
ncbi:hypothetical protein J6590_064417 [Homalodisca vitripennis]|nr:hypothetical protein J6590_064417 [Homalodisca vitripennis]